MRKLLTPLVLAALLVATMVVPAPAQTYPTNSPVYVPTAILPTQNLTTTGDVYFYANGTNAVSVRLSGTHGSVVAALQGTNQDPGVTNANATWTTLSIVPVAGGAAITSITGDGIWLGNGAGLNRLRLHVTTMASGTLAVNMAGTMMPGGLTILNPNTTSNPTTITDVTGVYNWVVSSLGIGSVKVTNGTQTMPTGDAAARSIFTTTNDGTNSVTVKAASTAPTTTDTAMVVGLSPNGGDPCQNAAVAKSSAIVNVGAATTTKIVDISGTKAIYLCSLHASLAGTTPSITFVSGTHVSADCDTAPANLSGVILPTTGSFLHFGGGGTVLQTAGTKQLCVTTVGSGSSLQGVLSYVQQ